MPRTPGSGMTLIELLVSVGITAGMAAVMLAMAGNVMSSWRSADGRLSAQVQAGTALARLQTDLEQALFRRDGNVWFAADTVRDADAAFLWEFPESGRMKPSDASWDPDRNRFGWGGVWLRFFTANPELRAVSYKIVRRTPTTNTPDYEARYMLYRGTVRAEKTFSEGYDIVAPAYNPGSSPGGPVWPGHPGEIQRPRRDSLLASHVVDFGVRLLWKTSNANGDPEYVEIFPDGEAGLAHRSPALGGNEPRPRDFADFESNNPMEYTSYQNPGESIPGFGSPPAAASTRVPDVAEITLRILTDKGAKLLAKYEAGRVEGDWWELVEQHSRIFTRRVVLQNAPAGF